MNWQDEGFLLSKIKFRENANIINVFTQEYGKVSGVVYGGNSRKVRNHLQIANKIVVFHTSKSESKMGYFKTELLEAISPRFFNDKKITSALLSLSSILNVLLPEAQPYKKIFKSINNFIDELNNNNWILSYNFWELNLLKELGYDPFLEQFKRDLKQANSNNISILIDNTKYLVPKFLIEKNLNENFNNKDVSVGLNFTRNLLLNKFFLPNNLIFPKTRIILENYFN